MTTPKEALEAARKCIWSGGDSLSTIAIIDEALASLEGDAVERVARIIDPVAFGSDADVLDELVKALSVLSEASAKIERLRLYSTGDWASYRENDALTIEKKWKDRAEIAESEIERLRTTLSALAHQNTKLRDELNQRYMAEVAREIGYVSSDNYDWDPLEWDPIERLRRLRANGEEILEPAITALEEAYVDIDKLWAALDTTKDELSTLRGRVRDVVGPFAEIAENEAFRLQTQEWRDLVVATPTGVRLSFIQKDTFNAARRLMEELK